MTEKEKISQDIRECVDKLNNLIEKAQKKNLTVHISQRGDLGYTGSLKNKVKVKVYEETIYFAESDSLCSSGFQLL